MPRLFHKRGAPASGQKVFIATPAFVGGIAGDYVSSMFHSAKALEAAGIQSEFCLLEGHGVIEDARNELAGQFLETDCTDLVFIDSDEGWVASDLVKLLQYDRDVVAGAYPAKDTIERYVAYLPPGENWADEDGLVEAECVATGFLRIKRHVIKTLADQAHWFQPNGGTVYCKAPLIFEFTFEDGRRWGEDFTFCRKWRRLGGKIYVAPEMRLQHYGQHVWRGTYGGFLRRENGTSLQHCLNAIARGDDTPETYFELHETWSNGAWPCAPDMLMAVATLARKTNGPIIEFGSGLSTLVARAANPVVPIVAYEHNASWAEKVDSLVTQCGLAEIEIKLGCLVGSPPFYQVSESDNHFALAICDGPPHKKHADRSKTYPVLSRVLRPGGAFTVDDLQFDGAKENFENWAKSVGAEYQIIDGAKMFGIGRMNEH